MRLPQPKTRTAGFDVSEETAAESPLDRPLCVTRFPDLAATEKKELRKSLRKIETAIVSRCAPTKHASPLLKLARFGDNASDNGCLRTNGNMLAIDGIEGDYDGEKVSPKEAARRLRKAGIAALVYTTSSHTDDKPRWRVLAPMSQSMSPKARGALCARLNGALGGILNGESFNPSLSYYYGGVAGVAPQTILIEGRYLDAADDVPSIGKGGATDAGSDPQTSKHGLVATHPQDIAATLMAIPNPPEEQANWEWWNGVIMAVWAACGGSEEGRALCHEWSQQHPDYNPAEVDERWDHFQSSPPTSSGFGKLVHLARQADPNFRRRSEVAKREELRSRFSANEDDDNGHTPREWSPAECEAADAPDFVIQRAAARGDVVCIYGQPGSGKSVIAPHIAYAVAQGRPVFGLKTDGGPVLYVTGEDQYGAMMRVKALRQEHGDAPDFRLRAVSDLLSDDAPDFAALRRRTKRLKPVLVVIDTLAACFPGVEENKAESMGKVAAKARELASIASRPVVCLIHHTPWGEPRMRGHSSLFGTLEMAMLVEEVADQRINRATLTKNKRGRKGLSFAFECEVIEFGRDKWGDPVTTVRAIERMDKHVLAPLNDAERAAFEILNGLLRERGTAAIPLSDLRDACRASGRMSSSDAAEAIRKAVKRAIDGLTAKGRIVVSGADVMVADDRSPSDARRYVDRFRDAEEDDDI